MHHPTDLSRTPQLSVLTVPISNHSPNISGGEALSNLMAKDCTKGAPDGSGPILGEARPIAIFGERYSVPFAVADGQYSTR